MRHNVVLGPLMNAKEFGDMDMLIRVLNATKEKAMEKRTWYWKGEPMLEAFTISTGVYKLASSQTLPDGRPRQCFYAESQGELYGMISDVIGEGFSTEPPKPAPKRWVDPEGRAMTAEDTGRGGRRLLSESGSDLAFCVWGNTLPELEARALKCGCTVVVVESKPKDCPACGLSAVLVTDIPAPFGVKYLVMCKACGLTGQNKPTRAEAIEVWNRMNVKP